MSGIMALFFHGVVLSHYNAYNLSIVAHVASEQIFSTFATLTETIVYVYMGMGVFTGKFQNWDLSFSIVAFVACLIGRFFNIIPLSFLANFCRERSTKISAKMQVVLWFAGLRGAVAFALSENMPGPHKDVYASTSLTICIVTTVFCGGFTERMLTVFEMREHPTPVAYPEEEDSMLHLNSLSYKPPSPQRHETRLMERRRRITEGIKGVWYRFDDRFLKPHFGGEGILTTNREKLSSQRSNDQILFDGNSSNGAEILESSSSISSTGDFEMGKVNFDRYR